MLNSARLRGTHNHSLAAGEGQVQVEQNASPAPKGFPAIPAPVQESMLSMDDGSRLQYRARGGRNTAGALVGTDLLTAQPRAQLGGPLKGGARLRTLRREEYGRTMGSGVEGRSILDR